MGWKLGSGLKEFANQVRDTVTDITGAGGDIISDAAQGISSLWKSGVASIKSLGSAAQGAAAEIGGSALSGVSDLTTSAIDGLVGILTGEEEAEAGAGDYTGWIALGVAILVAVGMVAFFASRKGR